MADGWKFRTEYERFPSLDLSAANNALSPTVDQRYCMIGTIMTMEAQKLAYA